MEGRERLFPSAAVMKSHLKSQVRWVQEKPPSLPAELGSRTRSRNQAEIWTHSDVPDPLQGKPDLKLHPAQALNHPPNTLLTYSSPQFLAQTNRSKDADGSHAKELRGMGSHSHGLRSRMNSWQDIWKLVSHREQAERGRETGRRGGEDKTCWIPSDKSQSWGYTGDEGEDVVGSI